MSDDEEEDDLRERTERMFEVLLGRHVVRLLQVRDERKIEVSDDQVYLWARADLGLGCPHPPHRVWAGCCNMCGSRLVPAR